jgi:colicin import membrane protein
VASGLFAPTALRRASGGFDMKRAMLEKQRKRELERAGIDGNEDDGPWVDPAEQARLDAEAEARRKEQEAAMARRLAERDAADTAKRADFKKWRAKQLARSTEQRKARAAAEEDDTQDARAARTTAVEVDEATEARLRKTGDLDEKGDYDSSETMDVSERRRFHKQMIKGEGES